MIKDSLEDPGNSFSTFFKIDFTSEGRMYRKRIIWICKLLYIRATAWKSLLVIKCYWNLRYFSQYKKFPVF